MARLLQRNDDFLIQNVMMNSEREREMPLQLPVASAYLCARHSVVLFALSLYVFGSPSDCPYSALPLKKIYMVEKQSALYSTHS